MHDKGGFFMRRRTKKILSVAMAIMMIISSTSAAYAAPPDGGNSSGNDILETTSDVVNGYTITFDNDEGVAGIDVYYTQDYTTPSEKNITTAIARNGDTGEVDISGDGQINFLVRLNDGYSVSSVSADANYKNVKGPGDTNVSNTYRITKISGDVNVTVKTAKCSHADISNPTWKWDDDCSKAAVTFDCADCNNTVTFEDTAISSVLNEDKTTITFTATYESSAGVKYTDTKTANAYVATFDVSNATVDVYYKQDYTKSDETGVESAIVRDGDSGNPVIDGKGQVNFKVTPAAGYEVAGITVTDGTYKNIKTSADDETIPANTYRITKITGNTTITVNVKQSSQQEEPTASSIKNATVTGVKSSYTYNGKKQTPTPSVALDGATLVNGTDYTVTYSNNKNVGTATVTIKGIGNYTDEIEVAFEITKAKNPVTLNKAKVTLKTKTDLSKAKKLKISVKNAQGAVTYSVNKKAVSAKIKVTAKGVVTVPKKCKKGTYKITVSAKGNKNYKSGKVVYTIVVK